MAWRCGPSHAGRLANPGGARRHDPSLCAPRCQLVLRVDRSDGHSSSVGFNQRFRDGEPSSHISLVSAELIATHLARHRLRDFSSPPGTRAPLSRESNERHSRSQREHSLLRTAVRSHAFPQSPEMAQNGRAGRASAHTAVRSHGGEPLAALQTLTESHPASIVGQKSPPHQEEVCRDH
jgi:hypothetical protein